MEKRADFRIKSGSKKSQKQKNIDFRANHFRVEVSFKKVQINKHNSKSEYDVLIKNASLYSKSISRYIKDCALESKIKVIEKQPLFDGKVFHELHKIGVNINQIAYKVNAKLDQKEFPDFEKDLAVLDQKLNDLLEIIRSK